MLKKSICPSLLKLLLFVGIHFSMAKGPLQLQEKKFYKVNFKDTIEATEILTHFHEKAIEVVWQDKYHVMHLTPQEANVLIDLRFAVKAYPDFDIHHNREKSPKTSANEYEGIPGYSSYLLVEETFHYAETLATNHPTLFEWIDVGDSWEKTQNNGGYDHKVLILTNKNIPGPKPKLFIDGSIHAREYTTAELARRYVSQLFNGYQKDPDATWLIDHHELHVLFYVNPDGRKHAEQGKLWRKNTSTDYCTSNPNMRGVDLNRNSSAIWAPNNDECSEVFPGSGAASEPEMQALEAYFKKLGEDESVKWSYINLHSYGEIIYHPTAMNSWVRKFSYFNGYNPIGGDGTTGGLAYRSAISTGGAAASCLFELGTAFFQANSFFEDNILPKNLPALRYAHKSARDPLTIAEGPNALELSIEGNKITAKIDDTQYGVTHPTQNISAAEYYIGKPPGVEGATAIAMTASDGSFNSKAEDVEGVLPEVIQNTDGRALIFVRGKDEEGNWGALSAVYAENLTNVKPNPSLENVTITQGKHGHVTIDLVLAKNSKTTLKVYNLQGELIHRIFSGSLQPGHHSIPWETRLNRQSLRGIYIIQVKTDSVTMTQRVFLGV